MTTKVARLLLATVVAASTVLMFAAPASARVVIKARANSWTAGGHIFAKIGEKVIWKNPTSAPHDVKSYNQGKRWRLARTNLRTNSRNQVVRRFKRRGNYYFRCTLHSFRDGNGGYEGMVGIVHARR